MGASKGLDKLINGESKHQGNHTVEQGDKANTRAFRYHGTVICRVNDEEKTVAFPYRGQYSMSMSTRTAVAHYRRRFSDYTVTEDNAPKHQITRMIRTDADGRQYVTIHRRKWYLADIDHHGYNTTLYTNAGYYGGYRLVNIGYSIEDTATFEEVFP